MESKKFLQKLDEYYQEYNYSDDYRAADLKGRKEKLGIIEAGYRSFFNEKLKHYENLLNKKDVSLKILDVGSGTGEFTVLMNLIGHDATGIELHKDHIQMAKILAKENNISEDIFLYNDKKILPFDDNTFDLITSFSVFEHMSDETLRWIIPEMHRVCKGYVYTLVPNAIKPVDDHTGLAFLSYMPRFIALMYLKIVKEKYEYSSVTISGEWDVYHRFLGSLKKIFTESGFKFGHLPDDLHYPSLGANPPIHNIGKKLKIFGLDLFIGIPFFANTLIKLGIPKQFFYPYLNLSCIPIKKIPHKGISKND